MKLFGTAGIRGSTVTKITPALCMDVGSAIATHYSGLGYSTLVCASDARTSSDALTHALISGALHAGMDVINAGTIPTPVAAYASREYQSPAVMITASHNPSVDNGIKVFCEGYEVSRETEESIESILSRRSFSKYVWDKCGKYYTRDCSEIYIQSVISYIGRFFPHEDLDGMRILVDGGNGVGTKILSEILSHFGAIIISCNDHQSGLFPGRPSEPTRANLKNTLTLASYILPDLIIAQDGDADRVQIFTSTMDCIPEDTLIAFFADYYSDPGDTVVASIDTSLRIDKVLEKKDVDVKRVPLGYLQEGVIQYNPPFAGEPWKHIHVKFGPWIDGIVSATMMSFFFHTHSVDELFEDIPSYPYTKRNIPLDPNSHASMLERLEKNVSKRKDISVIDKTSGIRINFNDDSWILIRPSGTEPKLRIIVEGTSYERLEELTSLIDTIMG